MKKTTILGVATVIMIVLNCILLFTLYARPESVAPGFPHPEPKQVIIDKLHFSPEQIIQYEVLIKVHRKNINKFDAEIRNTKEQLYSLLTNEKQAEKDSLITVINNYQKEIEYVHFKHFEDIKMLCTPEQKLLFEQLVPELPKLFGPKPPMGPHGMHGAPEHRP